MSFHLIDSRRKLSRETCNYKKLEANCDERDLPTEERKLNIVYSIKIPGESYKMAEFSRPPTDHHFPITSIGDNLYLKVVLESLPRTDEIPSVKCTCQPKRRVSKDTPPNIHDELVGKLNDLTLGPRCAKYSEFAINSNIGSSSRRLSIVSNPGSTEYVYTSNPADDKCKIVDDRMLTPCSESGKHKCSCDEESDSSHRSANVSPQETKKLDERRLKEIAKYKRRLRKESKIRKLCDSTSSEGEVKTTHTSIPILQASRFDRFRAIGCYRNQTYLTLPASRIEGRSPFIETESIQPSEFRKTNTVSTQTEEMSCQCGAALQTKCAGCGRGMVRSAASYDLASADRKKHKCDKPSSNSTCDINSVVDNSVSDDDGALIKRPRLRLSTDRIGRVMADRRGLERRDDIQELELRGDDTVFSTPGQDAKRQKTYSVNEEYVMYEKCDYGTIDRCETDSPREDSPVVGEEGFSFPEARSDSPVPSSSEMDRFRWRFESAASMVFHSKTGLPLTSSPAPLRRGNNCFDFDDSINGVSGIKRYGFLVFIGYKRPLFKKHKGMVGLYFNSLQDYRPT